MSELNDWQKSDNLVYLLKHFGAYNRGEPVLENDVTIRVECSKRAPGYGEGEAEQRALDMTSLVHTLLVEHTAGTQLSRIYELEDRVNYLLGRLLDAKVIDLDTYNKERIR